MSINNILSVFKGYCTFGRSTPTCKDTVNKLAFVDLPQAFFGDTQCFISNTNTRCYKSWGSWSVVTLNQRNLAYIIEFNVSKSMSSPGHMPPITIGDNKPFPRIAFFAAAIIDAQSFKASKYFVLDSVPILGSCSLFEVDASLNSTFVEQAGELTLIGEFTTLLHDVVVTNPRDESL